MGAAAGAELMMWTAPAQPERTGRPKVDFDRDRDRLLIMHWIVRIGLDIAKRWFQVRGVDEADKEVFNRKLPRDKVLGFLGSLPPCEVALEACSSSHYWGYETNGRRERSSQVQSFSVWPRTRRPSYRPTCYALPTIGFS